MWDQLPSSKRHEIKRWFLISLLFFLLSGMSGLYFFKTPVPRIIIVANNTIDYGLIVESISEVLPRQARLEKIHYSKDTDTITLKGVAKKECYCDEFLSALKMYQMFERAYVSSLTSDESSHLFIIKIPLTHG